MAYSVDVELDRPRSLRFTIGSVRALEKAAGMGISELVSRGMVLESVVLMTCYGLRHEDPRMTEGKAEHLLDAYLEKGGDLTEWYRTLADALERSGVFGKPDNGEAPPDPHPAA